jgi:hypothetical protein
MRITGSPSNRRRATARSWLGPWAASDGADFSQRVQPLLVALGLEDIEAAVLELLHDQPDRAAVGHAGFAPVVDDEDREAVDVLHGLSPLGVPADVSSAPMWASGVRGTRAKGRESSGAWRENVLSRTFDSGKR